MILGTSTAGWVWPQVHLVIWLNLGLCWIVATIAWGGNQIAKIRELDRQLAALGTDNEIAVRELRVRHSNEQNGILLVLFLLFLMFVLGAVSFLHFQDSLFAIAKDGDYYDYKDLALVPGSLAGATPTERLWAWLTQDVWGLVLLGLFLTHLLIWRSTRFKYGREDGFKKALSGYLMVIFWGFVAQLVPKFFYNITLEKMPYHAYLWMVVVVQSIVYGCCLAFVENRLKKENKT